MKIIKEQNGTSLRIAPEGPLDTASVPELERELKGSLDGITDLTIDLCQVKYISSSGLGLLLTTQRTMTARGTMKVIHVNETIRDVFDATGFSTVLSIE